MWEVIGPGLAAIAAGASWMSVGLSRRGLIDAERPHLVIYIFEPKDDEAKRAIRIAEVENVGNGPALIPGFWIYSGGDAGSSTLIGRTLAKGDKSRSGLAYETVEGAVSIVYCEDRRNNVHVWSSRRQYKRYSARSRGRKELTVRRMVEDFGLGVDVDSVHLLPTVPFS